MPWRRFPMPSRSAPSPATRPASGRAGGETGLETRAVAVPGSPRPASPRAAGAARARRRTIATILLAALAAGCQGSGAAPRPNLILVVTDTLRSDHLSAAGYPLTTSPNLERLAERGTFFDRFYAHSAVTRPSVATLFTSRFVSGHGITNQGGAGLAPQLPYLPEMLAEAGYRTLAFVTNPQIHPALGFARGFDRFDSLFAADVDPRRLRPPDLLKRPASEVFAAARQSLAESRERPFFVYIHLLDPHGPYDPPAEDVRKFVDPDYRGDITGSIGDFARHAYLASHPDELDHFRALYNAEVSSVDRAFGEFVGWLDEAGLMSDTHLLFTADHGEEFMEHGAMGHSTKLYQESIRIPLLWIGPGVPRGRRIDALAGLIDLLPTLVEVLDLPSPDAAYQGRSLRQLWADEPEGPRWREGLFLEGLEKRIPGEERPAVARGLITRTGKVLARGCVAGLAGCETLEIFDLAADPQEKRGRLVSRDPTSLSASDRRLLRLYELEEYRALQRTGSATAPTAELPVADLERLRSLGYLDP